MAVEMNDRHRPIGTVDGPEQRKGNGVVSPEGDDTRQRLAVLCGALLVGVRGRRSGEDAEVALLYLLERIRVVVSVPRGLAIAARWIGLPLPEAPYEVTGMSPQSRTVAQLWKGLTSKGTL